MDKNIISGNFSRSAASYDDHASVQGKCAEKLISLIRGRDFTNILEVGCGTGMYTTLLRDEYSKAEITAVDISGDMVRVAREKFPGDDIRFEIADGETIKFDRKFDLITSNASIQWFEDLDMTLRLFRDSLAGSGVLCFSMYGPETFQELKAVLGFFFGARRWLSSSRFVLCNEVENIVRKYFRRSEIAEERFNADFVSIWDLLKDIKHSGTRGEGLGDDIFLGKYTVLEMERKYIEKFGRITATHHVYFCRAET
ncbi:MAG: methyltransferase domain-containing protein [Candidatus Omnitrophota bacterium]|nr:methyltransferase domain-containing protein [Candidatus Omnitrophota bacterium]